MKRFPGFKAVLAALCIFAVPLSSQAIPMQIGEGDSFRFGIDLSSATPAGPYDYLAWYVSTYSSDGFDPGDIMSVALYDNADPSTALGSGVFDWTNGWFTTLGVGAMMASNPAFDGTGYLQFTMVSGTIDLLSGAVYGLNSLNSSTTTSGLTDITVIPATTVSVPEPDTLSLLGLALLLIAFASKLQSRKNKVALTTAQSVT